MGTSPAVQWLGLSTSTAEGLGSIPDQRTEILQAVDAPKKRKSKTEIYAVYGDAVCVLIFE